MHNLHSKHGWPAELSPEVKQLLTTVSSLSPSLYGYVFRYQLNCRTGSTQAYRICVRTMQPTAMRLGIHNSEIIDKFSKPLIHFIWTFHKNSSRSFRTKQWQLPYRGKFFSVGTEGHCRPKDPHPYKRIG